MASPYDVSSFVAPGLCGLDPEVCHGAGAIAELQIASPMKLEEFATEGEYRHVADIMGIADTTFVPENDERVIE